MDMTSWDVIEQNDVSAGVVTFSQQAWGELEYKPADIVKVSVKRQDEVLLGIQPWVQHHRKPAVRQIRHRQRCPERPAAVAKVSACKLRTHLVFGTREGLLSLLGLVVAIGATIAQAIKSSLSHPSAVWIGTVVALQAGGIAAGVLPERMEPKSAIAHHELISRSNTNCFSKCRTALCPHLHTRGVDDSLAVGGPLNAAQL
jgi:hypothetical protein